MNLPVIETLSPYQLERWQCLKNDSKVEHRFVFMLSPILEYIYQTISQHIQSLPVVHVLFEKFDLEGWLRLDLCNTFHPMLSRSCVLEMHYAKQLGYLEGNTPEARFQSYIEMLQTPEFVSSFMEKYHVLQGIIDHRATHYIHGLLRFLTHLDEDFIKVSAFLLPEHNDIDIMALKLNKLSSDGADVHCQGQRVFILDFFDHRNNSSKLVYKPHQLEPEEAFNHIIEWFNSYSPESALRPMRLINNEDHGWVEFISHKPCLNEEEIKLFYLRAGHLLAFLYMFHGLDIHYENLIAHGSYPVMVDLECFFTPDQCNDKENISYYTLPTVLNSLFLPSQRGHNKERSGIDMSALGFKGGENWFNKRFSWENSGTDEMRFARVETKTSPSSNRPFLKTAGDVDLLQYDQAISQGFEQAYFVILEHFEQIRLFLENCCIRLLFRPTAEYGNLLLESYHPSLLRNSEAYQKHMDFLKERIEEQSSYQHLIPSELLDLSTGDIPFFSTFVNSRQVFNSYFEETGYVTKKSGLVFLLWRIQHVFSERDHYRQQYLIQMSLALAKKNEVEQSTHQIAKMKDAHCHTKHIDLRNISSPALKYVEELLDELVELAFIDNNQMTWPDIQLDIEAKYLVLTPGLTGKNLYSGGLGILFAFLYGNRQIKKPSYERIIQQCLQSVYADILSEPPVAWLKNIGAFTGAAGVLYVLEHARQLGYYIHSNIEQKLLEIIKNNLAKEKTYNLMNGVAGLILVLMKIYRREPSPLIMALIQQNVQHLLNEYPDPTILPESLKENYYFPSTSFSHGVSGMAWALWQVRSVCSNQHTKQWIESALIYIKTTHERYGCFPDFRKFGDAGVDEKIIFPPSPFWCHDHIGIGFFYLELHQLNSPLAVYAPMDNMYKNMACTAKKKDDGSWCCSLSEIVFLWQLRQHDNKSNPKLLEKMIAQLFFQLSKKKYQDYAKGAGLSTNLMQGKAGIVYILLSLIQTNTAAIFLLL